MLTRFKTFVATGLATAGRLYAGDLNSIQDAVAAQSDYAQRVDALTHGIGEPGLTLTRYGSGEARLTGSMRLDAILRALGGLFAGQFTTAARDAIAAGAGLTPYGLIIFNTTTNRLEVNIGNDTVRNWKGVGGLSAEKNGAGAVSEGGINFIEGSGITITLVDNPGTGYADLTIAAPPAASAGTVPIGGITLYGGSSDPTNFLICDGRSLLRTGTYASLFAVIGTTFGFVDATHFNIPDQRGRVAAGVNAKVPLGGNEGISSVLANSRSPSHAHVMTYDISADDAVVGGVHLAPGHSPGNAYIPFQTGGDTANVNQPAWLGLNFIIRYQ